MGDHRPDSFGLSGRFTGSEGFPTAGRSGPVRGVNSPVRRWAFLRNWGDFVFGLFYFSGHRPIFFRLGWPFGPTLQRVLAPNAPVVCGPQSTERIRPLLTMGFCSTSGLADSKSALSFVRVGPSEQSGQQVLDVSKVPAGVNAYRLISNGQLEPMKKLIVVH